MLLHRCLPLLSLALAAGALPAAVPSDYKGTPYQDATYKSGAQNIPGIVQCAWYDLGGEGVAYHDTDASNNGTNLNREELHRRPHASRYEWTFREAEGVDLSYVKDFADLNHPNPVAPAANQLYIGWTADGEWCNYTVNVQKAGTYRVGVLYSNLPNSFGFSFNGGPVTKLQLPTPTGHWHTWNYASAGTVRITETGPQVLQFTYGTGNNFAFFVFERVGD